MPDSVTYLVSSMNLLGEDSVLSAGLLIKSLEDAANNSLPDGLCAADITLWAWQSSEYSTQLIPLFSNLFHISLTTRIHWENVLKALMESS